MSRQRIASPFFFYPKSKWTQRFPLRLSLVVIAFLFFAPGWAASFDCTKSGNPVEEIICNDAEISRKDEVLSAIYKHALTKTADQDVLIAAQRAWLKERDRCGDAACILHAYQKRIAELTKRRSPQRLNPLLEPVSVPEGEATELERPYVLEKGEGLDICQAYQKNLNSYRPKVPWKCDRPVNKAIAGFEHQPDWQRRDKAPTGEQISTYHQQMTELLWERDVNPAIYHTVSDWADWQGAPEQLERAKHKYEHDRTSLLWPHAPYVATLDIDNDGVSEPIYLEQPCGSVFGARLAALTPDWKGIDREKTEKLMPHRPFDREGRGVFRTTFPNEMFTPEERKRGYTAIEDAWHDLYYDVFLYRRATYFDQWWGMHPDFKGQIDMVAGRLRVFQATPDGTKEICAYKFVH